ncbi:MAG: extracellular solute-binding protein [Lachnospiraceae bacterium]|nr:extracellular solute-binding protein [Lachnospiraceae bacterium]
MIKRIIHLFLVTFVVGVLFTGCAKDTESAATKASDNSAASSGNVALRVWGSEEDTELMQSIIEGFKAEYSGQANFNITYEAHSEANCKDDILGDVLNAPDVFTFADDQLMALVASGVLKEVENASAISGRNLQASSAAASINGKLYAYPLTADNGYFLFYNKKYVCESDAETMDGLLKAAEACEKQIFMDMTSGWYLYAFFGNTDMQIGLNDDGISTYCNWNAKYTETTGEEVASGILRIGMNPAFTAVTPEGFTKGAADDLYIAGVSGIWDENAIKEAWGDNYAATKLPTYTVSGKQLQMSSYAGYKLVGVNSYSANVSWAAKLADWITNEKNQTLRFDMRGQGPSNITASGQGAVAESKAIQALQAQAPYSSLQRVGGTYWGPSGEFGIEMSNGNPSGKDLQVLLNEMVKGITGEESTGDPIEDGNGN